MTKRHFWMAMCAMGTLMGAAGVAAGFERGGGVFYTGDVILLSIAAAGCVLNLYVLAERVFLEET